MSNLSICGAKAKIYNAYKRHKISFITYDGFNSIIDSYSVMDDGTKINDFSKLLQSIYDLTKKSIKSEDKNSDNYSFDLIYSIVQYIATCTKDFHYIQEFVGKDVSEPLKNLQEIRFDNLYKNILKSDNKIEIRWRISQLCTISRFLNIVYGNKYVQLNGKINKNIRALDKRLQELVKDKNVM